MLAVLLQKELSTNNSTSRETKGYEFNEICVAMIMVLPVADRSQSQSNGGGEPTNLVDRLASAQVTVSQARTKPDEARPVCVDKCFCTHGIED